MILSASLQAIALGRQRSGYLRQAHFITSSKKGLVNLVGLDELKAILNENFPKVKRVAFG